MLDDILALFRRRAPVRKRRAAPAPAWRGDFNPVEGPRLDGPRVGVNPQEVADRIRELVGLPVSVVSVGPDRAQTILT